MKAYFLFVVFTVLLLSSYNAFCQEQKEFTSTNKYKYDGTDFPKMYINFDEAKVFVLDEKVVKENPLKALKREEIESVVFYSGDEAIKKYGKKAGEGVLEVITARK